MSWFVERAVVTVTSMSWFFLTYCGNLYKHELLCLTYCGNPYITVKSMICCTEHTVVTCTVMTCFIEHRYERTSGYYINNNYSFLYLSILRHVEQIINSRCVFPVSLQHINKLMGEQMTCWLWQLKKDSEQSEVLSGWIKIEKLKHKGFVRFLYRS
jgi:hypothetical protein